MEGNSEQKNYIIPVDRVSHMHMVAEYMYAHADEYGLMPEDMYILGFVHDIGYVGGEKDHEVNGGMLLANLGLSVENADIIINHGKELSKLKEVPPALSLLAEADMHIDSRGDLVSFEERLKDIISRHGKDSKAYKISKSNIEWLIKHGRE